MEGRRVRASQDDDEYRTRAIWLNEIDKERTFNRKFEQVCDVSTARVAKRITDEQQCRMIYTLLCYRINQGEEPSFIETEYLHAVEEYRVHQEPDYAPFLEQGDAFENREAFIKVWREGDKDLFVFPKHEVKRFKELVGSLSEFNQHTVPPPPSFEDTDEEFNAFVAQDYETSGHAPTAVTPLAGPEAAGFRAVATDEVRLGDLPKEYKPAQPVSLTKPSTKGIFKMRAEHQVDEEDSDDDGDEGEGDELMRSSDMPEIARTWLDILDEYNDLVEHGGLSDDANRARATKLQEELARAMSANQSEKQILAKLEDTRL